MLTQQQKLKQLHINFLHPLPWIMLGTVAAFAWVVHVDFGPDSMHYVDIARNLVSGHGFSTYHLNLDSRSVPDHRLIWPPLYPILLALGMSTGLSVLWTIRLILVGSFLVSAIGIYKIGRRLSSSEDGVLCLAIWIALAPSLMIWNFACSESPFIAIASVSLIVLASALDNHTNTATRMVMAGIVAGLATMVKYIGITIFLSGFILLAYQFLLRHPKAGVKHFLLYSLCVSLGFAVITTPWFLRNFLLTGSPTGGWIYPPSETGPVANVMLFARAMLSDLTLPLGMIFTLITLSTLNRSNCFLLLKNIWNSINKHLVIILCAWLFIQYILQIALSSLIKYETINSRRTSLIYVALIPLLVYIGYEMYKASQTQSVRMSNFSLGIIFCVILAVSIGNVGTDLHRMRRDQQNLDELNNWIEKSTPADALFIGDSIWRIRYGTGRVVLESGYTEMPDLTPQRVSDFLQKFGKYFSHVYLISNFYSIAAGRQIQEEFKTFGYGLEKQYDNGFEKVYKILELKKSSARNAYEAEEAEWI